MRSIAIPIITAALFALLACGPAPVPPAPAASAPGEAQRIAAIVDPIIEADLAASGKPGAAFIFVRDGRVVYQRGYGLSDVASATPAHPVRTIWPVASITKAITAIAALRLVDEGRVDLDADINSYLRRLTVPAQGYSPLTLRHLLTHTAALDELPGRQFDGAAPPDTAAFLRNRLIRYRAPGERTAYGSYGMALLSVLLEDVSGQGYADHVRDRVFRPAGMEQSRIVTRRGDERGVATPYRIEDGRAEPAPYEYYVTPATSSMVATAADMGRLASVLLDRGRAGSERILSPRLAEAMHRQQATVHPDLPGWGLGLQIDRVNNVRIAEHGGDIGGFASLFSLLPEHREGFFIVHHGEGSDLRFQVRQALLDGLHPAAAEAVPAADPSNAARLGEYAGRYLSTMACRSCPGAEAQAFELTARPDGSLFLWGRRWLPLGRDLFVRDDGRRRLGFARDREGRIASVSGGSWRVADRLR